MLAPEVRSQFAQRLKNLRTQRGFDRARYFAKSLGIEENRYTRYERAEVEPNLTLIHKMCETLRVSPNELLGFGDLRYPHAPPGDLGRVIVRIRRLGQALVPTQHARWHPIWAPAPSPSGGLPYVALLPLWRSALRLP